jgi:hypothetical protein
MALEVLARDDLDQTGAQPCQTCGKLSSPFRYGPPLHAEAFWRCGAHRVEGAVQPAPRGWLLLETSELTGRMIDGWLETQLAAHDRRQMSSLPRRGRRLAHPAWLWPA